MCAHARDRLTRQVKLDFKELLTNLAPSVLAQALEDQALGTTAIHCALLKNAPERTGCPCVRIFVQINRASVSGSASAPDLVEAFSEAVVAKDVDDTSDAVVLAKPTTAAAAPVMPRSQFSSESSRDRSKCAICSGRRALQRTIEISY